MFREIEKKKILSIDLVLHGCATIIIPQDTIYKEAA